MSGGGLSTPSTFSSTITTTTTSDATLTSFTENLFHHLESPPSCDLFAMQITESRRPSGLPAAESDGRYPKFHQLGRSLKAAAASSGNLSTYRHERARSTEALASPFFLIREQFGGNTDQNGQGSINQSTAKGRGLFNRHSRGEDMNTHPGTHSRQVSSTPNHPIGSSDAPSYPHVNQTSGSWRAPISGRSGTQPKLQNLGNASTPCLNTFPSDSEGRRSPQRSWGKSKLRI